MNFIRETVSYVIGSKGQTGFGSSTTAAQVLEGLPAESYKGKVILITVTNPPWDAIDEMSR
jgi:hypothetical protein